VLPDHVSKAIVIPDEVKGLEGKTKHAASLSTDFEGFKKYLLKNG